MTDQEIIDAETYDDSNAVALGKKLQDLRESRGYSLDDVAGQLYLDITMVSALEAGDYSSAPSKTYVKGYIRNYIKLFDAKSEFENFGLYESESDPVIMIPDTITYNKKFDISKYIKIEYLWTIIIFFIIFGLYIIDYKYHVFEKIKEFIPFSIGS